MAAWRRLSAKEQEMVLHVALRLSEGSPKISSSVEEPHERSARSRTECAAHVIGPAVRHGEPSEHSAVRAASVEKQAGWGQLLRVLESSARLSVGVVRS